MKLNWFKYNQKPSNEDLLNILKRIERAYNIVDLNKQEQITFEKDGQQQLFDVKSTKDKADPTKWIQILRPVRVLILILGY